MVWDTQQESTGGLLPEYDATVDDAYYGTDPNYMQGTVPLLHLRLVNITVDGAPFEGADEFVEKYSIGNDWEIVDGGARVVNTKRDDITIPNARSKYGMIVKSLRTGELQSAGAVMEQRGNPNEAKIWKGLRFTFKRTPVNYGKNIGEREIVMPVAFLGSEDGLSVFEPDQSGSERVSGNGSQAEIRDRLAMLARNVATYAAFMDDATKIPEVLRTPELLELVTGPEFYNAARA